MIDARAIKVAAGVFLMLAVLGRGASAQISEYADMWPSEDVDANGAGTLYTYGAVSAEGDGWIRMQMRTYDGNGASIDLRLANGYYYVEKESSVSITENSVMGEYKVVVTADYDFEHYACAIATQLLGAGIKTYVLDTVIDNGKARYVRCNGSDNWCRSMIVGRNRLNPPQSTGWPIYLFINVTSVNLGVVRICWGHSTNTTFACYPDPM